MNLSYREKIIYFQLFLMAGILVYYVVRLLGFSNEELANIDVIMSLNWKIIGWSIAISFIFIVVLTKFEPEASADLDERERLCEYRSNFYGYWVLHAGILIPFLIYALENGATAPWSITPPPFLTLHAIVVLIYLTHLGVMIAELSFLRRGV